MSEPSSGRPAGSGSTGPNSGDSWEQRAADLANEMQRRLIRSGARSVRDEVGDQVKKAFRGKPSDPKEVWATATTEPPDALNEAPECAWCPICRAARRMAQAQAQTQTSSTSSSTGTTGTARDDALNGARAAATQAGPVLAGAANALVGVARDALEGLDAILSYRPGDLNATKSANGTQPSQNQTSQPDQSKEAEHEPDHRS